MKYGWSKLSLSLVVADNYRSASLWTLGLVAVLFLRVMIFEGNLFIDEHEESEVNEEDRDW